MIRDANPRREYTSAVWRHFDANIAISIGAADEFFRKNRFTTRLMRLPGNVQSFARMTFYSERCLRRISGGLPDLKCAVEMERHWARRALRSNTGFWLSAQLLHLFQRSCKGPIRVKLRVERGAGCGPCHVVSMSCVLTPLWHGRGHRFDPIRSNQITLQYLLVTASSRVLYPLARVQKGAEAFSPQTAA